MLIVTVSGDDAILNLLTRTERQLENPMEALYAAGKVVQEELTRNFDSRGRLYGGWKARKSPDRYSHPLMNKTGALKGGFSIQSGVRQVRIYNTKMDDYGKFHQTGTRNMPKRQIIGLTEELRKKAATAFKRELRLK